MGYFIMRFVSLAPWYLHC